MKAQKGPIPTNEMRVEIPVVRRLVAVHQGALGDFLLTIGVIEGLYDACHLVRFDFWTKPEHFALIANKPYTGDVHSSESSELSTFYHDALWQEARIPPFFLYADTIFILGQEGARLLAERLSNRLGCPVHWVRSFPGPQENVPVSQFIARQFEDLCWKVNSVTPRIDPAPSDALHVRQWLAQRGWSGNRPVFVHLGSGGKRKIWPLARWWRVLRWLRFEAQLPVVIARGPADMHLMDFMERSKSLGVELLDRLDLPRLAAFISQSRFYLGNDSGVSHLAGLVGTPTIAIFGPTAPETWAPRGPRVLVVKSSWDEEEIFDWDPDLPGGSMEAVVQRVLEDLIAESRIESPAGGDSAAAPVRSRKA